MALPYALFLISFLEFSIITCMYVSFSLCSCLQLFHHLNFPSFFHLSLFSFPYLPSALSAIVVSILLHACLMRARSPSHPSVSWALSVLYSRVLGFIELHLLSKYRRTQKRQHICWYLYNNELVQISCRKSTKVSSLSVINPFQLTGQVLTRHQIKMCLCLIVFKWCIDC